MPIQYKAPIGPSQPTGRDTQGNPTFSPGLSKSGEGYKPPQWFPSGGGSAIPSSAVSKGGGYTGGQASSSNAPSSNSVSLATNGKPAEQPKPQPSVDLNKPQQLPEQQKGFSGSVEQSFKGQQEAMTYFVGGKEVGKIQYYSQGNKIYSGGKGAKLNLVSGEEIQTSPDKISFSERIPQEQANTGVLYQKQIDTFRGVPVFQIRYKNTNTGVDRLANSNEIKFFRNQSNVLKTEELPKTPLERLRYELNKETERLYPRAQMNKLNVGENVKSFGLGAGSALLSIPETIVHPIQAVKSMADLLVHPRETGADIGKVIRTNPAYALGYAGGTYLGGKAIKFMGNKVVSSISDVKEMKSFGKDFVFEKPATITKTPFSSSFPVEIKLQISDVAIKNYVSSALAKRGVDYTKLSGIERNWIEGQVKARIRANPEKFIPETRRIALERQGIKSQEQMREYTLKRISGQYDNLDNKGLIKLSEQVEKAKELPLSEIQQISLKRFAESLNKERIKRMLSTTKKALERSPEETQRNINNLLINKDFLKNQIIARAKADPSSFVTGVRKIVLEKGLKASERERMLSATKKALERTPEETSKDISNLLIDKKGIREKIIRTAKYEPEKFIPKTRQIALQILKKPEQKPVDVVRKIMIGEPSEIQKLALKRAKTKSVSKRSITSLLIGTEEKVKQISRQVPKQKQIARTKVIYATGMQKQKQSSRQSYQEQLKQIQKQGQRLSPLSLIIPQQRFNQRQRVSQRYAQGQPSRQSFTDLIFSAQTYRQPQNTLYGQRYKQPQPEVATPRTKQPENNINRMLIPQPSVRRKQSVKRGKIKESSRAYPTITESILGLHPSKFRVSISGFETKRGRYPARKTGRPQQRKPVRKQPMQFLLIPLRRKPIKKTSMKGGKKKNGRRR